MVYIFHSIRGGGGGGGDIKTYTMMYNISMYTLHIVLKCTKVLGPQS